MAGNENFESRLLTELRQVAAENPAPQARTSRRRPYGRFAAAGTGVAAVIAAVAIFASSGGNTPSAYAVETQANGMVTVDIKSLKDAEGLEQKLNEAGVPAEVNYTPIEGDCVPAIGAAPEGGQLNSVEKEDGGPSLETAGAPPKGEAGKPGWSSGMASKGPDGVLVKTRSDEDGTTFSIDPGTLNKGEKVFITTSTGPGVSPAPDGEQMGMESVAVSIGKQARNPGC
jgi:hypothetical protein